jgi:hypothetical protein
VFTLARRLCRDHSETALRGIEKAAARISAGIASANLIYSPGDKAHRVLNRRCAERLRLASGVVAAAAGCGIDW